MECRLAKHKWDCMANPDEEEETQLPGAPLRKEKEDDSVRLQQLAEELAAESRTTFDEKTNTMNLNNNKKLTDYCRNSRVVLPRGQSGIKESNLRRELQEIHRHWMINHCSWKGEHTMNIDEFELAGLKSLRKHVSVSEGELVIIPIDKSGQFAAMSWPHTSRQALLSTTFAQSWLVSVSTTPNFLFSKSFSLNKLQILGLR